MNIKKLSVAALLGIPILVSAAPPPAPVTPTGPSWAGMIFTLIFLAGMAWLAKKYAKKSKSSQLSLRVVGGASLGGKERVAVIEVEGQWLVLGVAQGSISTLATFPARENTSEETVSHAAPFTTVLARVTNLSKIKSNVHDSAQK